LYDFQEQIQNEILEILKLDLKISITQRFNSMMSIISESQSVEIDDNLAKKFYEYIEQNYRTQITLEDIANHFIGDRVCLIGVADPFFGELSVEPINAAKKDPVHLGACGKRL
jgi:YesN/AraC family two-component response regulator